MKNDMDIKSPKVLKLKGMLFLLLGVMSGGLLLVINFSWENTVLLVISVWAFCRFYYFAFYVLEHYADDNFRYAGLWDLVKYLIFGRKSDQ